jgi:hypothetical protein
LESSENIGKRHGEEESPRGARWLVGRISGESRKRSLADSACGQVEEEGEALGQVQRTGFKPPGARDAGPGEQCV